MSTEAIYTDKVFTVDFKRPAGGTLGISDTTFDAEQYFSKIKATYTENTLKDINTAFQTLTGQATSVKIGDNEQQLVVDEREVARARFDISEPRWEERMHAFVDQHVTGCYVGCHYTN